LVISAVSPQAKILILSSLGEPCTQWVTKELEKAGTEYSQINFEDALLNNRWSISIDQQNDAALILTTKGRWLRVVPASVCVDETLGLSSLPSIVR
jgi:hypothetical protein